MTSLNNQNNNIFTNALAAYDNWIEGQVRSLVVEKLNMCPVDLRKLRDTKHKAIRKLQSEVIQNQSDLAGLEASILSVLKRSVIHYRREVATRNKVRADATHSPEMRATLEKEITDISAILEWGIFNNIEAYTPPKLTDYLTLKAAEEGMKKRGHSTIAGRQYDEKFNILMAPTLFQSDLNYFREQCDMRGKPTTVVFLDIDDFKAFNTQFGEIAVDRYILPIFMSRMESHVYSKGFAYRYGGDEYAMILPNMCASEVEIFLKELQVDLSKIGYEGVDKNPTVSIGIFEIRPGSPFIGEECLERAQLAKDAAKESGKDAIHNWVE